MLYGDDLAFIQASGFGGSAAHAIAELIPRLEARAVRRVIDVGCGAGVTTKALVDAGFDTLAIEPSAALLAMARTAAPGAEFQQASAYDAELGACDAILAIGEPLTYHPHDSDAGARLRGFFNNARHALRRDGLLIFDLIEAEGGSLDVRSWKSGPDWAVLSEAREDRDTGRLTRTIQTFRRTEGGKYRRGEEVHHVRLFARGALREWLQREGFDVEIASAYGQFRLPPRRIACTAWRRA